MSIFITRLAWKTILTKNKKRSIGQHRTRRGTKYVNTCLLHIIIIIMYCAEMSKKKKKKNVYHKGFQAIL